jgi:hypothetical protein
MAIMSKTIRNAMLTPRILVRAALAMIVLASPAHAEEAAGTAPGLVPTTSTATTAAPGSTPAPPTTTDAEHAASPEVAQAPPPPTLVATAEAPETPAEETPTPELQLNGSFDAYTGVNFTNPDSGSNRLRAFDGEDRGFALNYAELVLARNKGPLGFRVDAGFGYASDALFAVDNASVSMDSSTVRTAKALSHIQQAYVTGKLGDVTLDLGKFVTMHGYEVIETKDNYNYSRSVLFTWAIPFLHTGLRASYPVNDQLSLMGCWTNGWNTNIQDGNNMTSLGLQAIYKPITPLALVVNYMGGRERAIGVEELTMRHLLDVSASYAVNDKLTVAVNGDYGYDAANRGVTWSGVAGYGRYQFLPWLAGAVRAEYFSDPDGFMTTVAQKIMEGTATAEVTGKIGPTAVLGRLEYRHDQSDAPFFDAMTPTTKKSQDTLLLGAVAAF